MSPASRCRSTQLSTARIIIAARPRLFHIAPLPSWGAVLVDIPKDVLQGQCTFSWPPRMELPGYKPNTKPHSRQVREAAKLTRRAQAGAGVGGGVPVWR